MHIKFLGTGAAEGVPALFCRCPTCLEIRRRGEREYHTRSQILIDETLGIDFPPDAYYHALRFALDLTRMQYLLVTHSHMDHFYAHDFVLRGYKYASEGLPKLYIYGNEEVAKVFAECTKRELKKEVAENICMTAVKPFQPFSIGERNEYKATALLAQHSKMENAYVYLLEKGDKTYLHLTDSGRLPRETLEYLENYLKSKNKKVDLVTFDCTFLYRTGGEISRHMGLEDNQLMQTEFLRRGIVKTDTMYVITHYSHNNEPFSETLERANKEYGYLPAFDGLELKI